MHLRFAVVLFVMCVSVALVTGDLEPQPSNLHEAPPVKLDKTLRRALLRALSDLEEQSAEQNANEDSQNEFLMDEPSPKNVDVVDKKQLEKNFGKSTFSFSSFLNDDETVNEDKLQNSTFIEIEKFVSSNSPMNLRTVANTPEEFLKGFQDTDSISPEKSAMIYKTKQDQVDPRSVKSSSPSSANAIETATFKSTTQFTETLIRSESNGIATANTLVSPKPTVSSPTVPPVANVSLSSPEPNKEEENVEDVKIFQAPLVAAFTVQQDERGIPKSVVPIYRPSGDGQALTLQEQLDFKQKLIEKQLLELQQQQVQQTQFLLRQQQAYEEQLRQEQQQEIFLHDHARLKQLQEQARLKQLEEQRQKQFEDQIRQKQLEEQRFYQQRLQQQQLQQQRIKKQQQQIQQHQKIQQHQQIQQQQIHQQQLQQQQFPIVQNNVLSFKQPFKSDNVRLQPSISLEVSHDTPVTPFQTQFQDQLRTQQLRLHQQQQLQQQKLQQKQQFQQHQHLQQHQLQQQQQLHQSLQQQKLQQSFASFSSDLQPPVASATRFNRQEAFESVGNFGFNVDNRSPARNTFGINNVQQRSPQSVTYNQFHPFRPSRPAPSSTPAKQIQHLLYQSGIANELQTGVQGFPGSQEDLNIVSKVLALNVGAVPSSNNLQFDGSRRVNAYARAPSVA